MPLPTFQTPILGERSLIYRLRLAQVVEAITDGDIKLLHSRGKCLLNLHEAGLHARFQVTLVSQ
jgi:hypothetical protein